MTVSKWNLFFVPRFMVLANENMRKTERKTENFGKKQTKLKDGFTFTQWEWISKIKKKKRIVSRFDQHPNGMS